MVNAKRFTMNGTQLAKSRLVVGVILMTIAVLMFVFTRGDYTVAGAVAIGVLGLISIAISRREPIL